MTVRKKMRIVIVLGYGVKLTPAHETYLDQAAANAAAYCADLLLVSGGRTSRKSHPGVSEASVMAETLSHVGVECVVVREEVSVTTLENLMACKEILRDNDIQPTHMTIFCDSTRKTKVAWLARWIFGKGVEVRGVPVTTDSARFTSPQCQKSQVEVCTPFFLCPKTGDGRITLCNARW